MTRRRDEPDTPLRLHAVAHRFGRRWVLRGVDLRVDPGEVVALTGRNGSGKTTLLRICATLLRPTRGGGRIFGHELVAEAAGIRPLVGLLGHESGLYDDLTAEENLRFAVRMGGGDAARIPEALERVGLLADRAERVRGFSAGMRRRLALARLLLRPPSLLLLDEPYASFDAEGVATLNGFAAQVAEGGGAVLVATHDTERGRALLTREARLRDGRLVEADAHGTAAPDRTPTLRAG